jgi:hypothetical protein
MALKILYLLGALLQSCPEFSVHVSPFLFHMGYLFATLN